LKILVVNPGSSSTKLALFEGKTCKFIDTIEHSLSEFANCNKIVEQLPKRMEFVMEFLESKGIKLDEIDAFAGRGAPIKPLESGTYEVNEKMVYDLKYNAKADHASLLGGLIAKELADKVNKKAYIADPVSVDEMIDLARYSGLPEIQRQSLSHALNIKAVARKSEKDVGKPYTKSSLIIVHLGSGISVTAHLNGRMIDVSNANSGGPFSPERAGALPSCELVNLAFSGKYTKAELKKRMTKQGGLIAYLGTINARQVEEMIEQGDKKAKEVYEAMAFQIAKEIGAMATVLYGKLDAIIFTGGLAKSKLLMDMILPRIEFFGRCLIYPGENEMEALALAVLRVLTKKEECKIYS